MRGKLALLLLWAAAPIAAHDEGDCSAFSWNVSRELEAMRAQARPVSPAVNPQTNPVQLQEGTHFSATLLPQDSITFAAPPGKKARAEKPTAGLLFFRSTHGGAYRISLTSHHWVDVVDGARAIDSRAHQGRSTCKLVHKIVEFELPAGRLLTIQLSGDDADTVGIVVTAVRKT
jgi:hypothetical protein